MCGTQSLLEKYYIIIKISLKLWTIKWKHPKFSGKDLSVHPMMGWQNDASSPLTTPRQATWQILLAAKMGCSLSVAVQSSDAVYGCDAICGRNGVRVLELVGSMHAWNQNLQRR
jgi:hypothetical protein